MDSDQHSRAAVPAASETSTPQPLGFELLSNAVAHSAAIRIVPNYNRSAAQGIRSSRQPTIEASTQPSCGAWATAR